MTDNEKLEIATELLSTTEYDEYIRRCDVEEEMQDRITQCAHQIVAGVITKEEAERDIDAYRMILECQ